MANPEIMTSPNRQTGFLDLWKKFNKISALVLAGAGIILDQTGLLGLAAVDVAQNAAINGYQKRRQARRSAG